MSKKNIIILAFFCFFTFSLLYAQDQSVTKNLRVSYDIVDEDTGFIIRKSTAIVTIFGPITYDKIIEATAKNLGFTKQSNGTYKFRPQGKTFYHLLVINNYEVLE